MKASLYEPSGGIVPLRMPAAIRASILTLAIAALLLCAPSLAGQPGRDLEGPVLELTSYICVTPPGVPCPQTTWEIIVVFDEAIDPVTASDPTNYTLYPQSDPSTIIPVEMVFEVFGAESYLLLSGLPDAVNHVLEVEGVADLEGNIMAPGQSVILEPIPDLTPVPRIAARLPVLRPNVPNPFNPSTRVSFVLPDDYRGAVVSVQVHDLRGRLIRCLLLSNRLEPGLHEVVWNGLDDRGLAVASGTYLIRLSAGDFTAVQKAMLAK